MTAFDYPRLDERLYRQKLSNGLTVMVVPRPGFTRKLAYFVTDFGSIHTDFKLEGREIHVPAGIAHFLEHKMFDLPGDRDVSAELAALGAGTNAFTSYDMTAYYITCTENFEPALRLLLEFVSTPYFTEESVQKEIGIIDQEIGMNEDAPETKSFEWLMQNMYRNHPIRVPILGTCESIREITPQMLYDCHRAFYTPGNMILCVVGDVDPDRIAEIAEEMLGTCPCSRSALNVSRQATAKAPSGRRLWAIWRRRLCSENPRSCICGFMKRDSSIPLLAAVSRPLTV